MRTEKVMKESVPETTTEIMTAETDTRGEPMIGLMILTDTETMTDNLETGEVMIDKSMREEMSIAESRRKPRSLTKLLMKLQGRERKVSRGRPQMVVEEEQMVSGTPSGRGCSWMRS